MALIYRRVPGRGQFVDQVEVLEHEADVLALQLGQALLAGPGHFLAHEFQAAFAGRVDQAHDVQQGGLAAAGRAGDGDELAEADLHRYGVDGACLHLPAIDLGDVGQA